jgi:hypothetical protein
VGTPETVNPTVPEKPAELPTVTRKVAGMVGATVWFTGEAVIGNGVAVPFAAVYVYGWGIHSPEINEDRVTYRVWPLTGSCVAVAYGMSSVSGLL